MTKIVTLTVAVVMFAPVVLAALHLAARIVT